MGTERNLLAQMLLRGSPSMRFAYSGHSTLLLAYDLKCPCQRNIPLISCTGLP